MSAPIVKTVFHPLLDQLWLVWAKMQHVIYVSCKSTNMQNFGPSNMFQVTHPKATHPSDTSKRNMSKRVPSATRSGEKKLWVVWYVCVRTLVACVTWRMCVVVVVVVVYKCAYCMCSVATDETSRPHHVARKGHICTHACRVTQPLNSKQNDVQKDSRHLITLYTVTRPPNTCVTKPYRRILSREASIPKGVWRPSLECPRNDGGWGGVGVSVCWPLLVFVSVCSQSLLFVCCYCLTEQTLTPVNVDVL